MIPGPTRDTGSALEGSFSVEPLDWWRARLRGERLPEHQIHHCEDCGEPATRETADGVWLCEGDFDALLDAAFWNMEGDHL